jgi:hypothetical protein
LYTDIKRCWYPAPQLLLTTQCFVLVACHDFQHCFFEDLAVSIEQFLIMVEQRLEDEIHRLWQIHDIWLGKIEILLGGL